MHNIQLDQVKYGLMFAFSKWLQNVVNKQLEKPKPMKFNCFSWSEWGIMLLFFYLQAAIANARSLDEVQRLEMLLKTGQVPGRSKQNDNVDEEMEDISNGTWTDLVLNVTYI